MSIPRPPQFTDKQGQYLAFIHHYALLNRRPPVEADMEAFFRVTPQILVRDTGAGMTEAVQAKIFEPFFSTKGESHGTGLGLATVKEIVEHARGAIRVRSKLGAGTEIEVDFPASHLPSRQSQRALPETLGPPAAGCILVVDSDPSVASAIGAALDSAGYRVAFAHHAADVESAARAEPTLSLLICGSEPTGSSGANRGGPGSRGRARAAGAVHDRRRSSVGSSNDGSRQVAPEAVLRR